MNIVVTSHMFVECTWAEVLLWHVAITLLWVINIPLRKPYLHNTRRLYKGIDFSEGSYRFSAFWLRSIEITVLWSLTAPTGEFPLCC